MGLRSGGAAHDAASEPIAQPMVSCTDFPMRDSISTRVVSVPIPEPAGGRVITRFAEGAWRAAVMSEMLHGFRTLAVLRAA